VIQARDTQPPSDPVDASSLDSAVETGLRWAMMRQVVTGLVSSAGVLAYTRLLQPEDLGAFGLAFLVFSGLFLLVQAPIRDAVVYFQDRRDGRASKIESHADAAFWLLLGFSVVAVALVMIFAGPLGRFYESPLAAGLTRAMAVTFFFQGVAVVPAALLLKHFRFAIHEGLQTVYFLILFAGWVILAVSGYGPWSLVIAPLAGSVFWSVATWIAVRFRPALRPGRAAYRDILRFSRSLFGSKLITYLKLNVDNAAVGTLGEASLGVYGFGEDQSAFAVIGVGAPVAQIALPVMAAVQDRLEKLRQIYLDMLRLTATLSTPMQIGAIVLADLGISLAFGEQWTGAVPVFRAYLAFRLVDTLLEISNSAISAIGRPDVRFVVDLAQLPFFIAGTWFGLQVLGGIIGVAWSLAIVRIVAGVAYFAVTMHLTQLRVGDALRYLLPSSLAGTLMGISVHALRNAAVVQELTAPIDQPLLADALNLIALALVGVVGYFAILFALDRSGSEAVMTLAWHIILPEPLRTRLTTFWGGYSTALTARTAEPRRRAEDEEEKKE
jgi:O-antigen/teichoic acid export membrane protein